MGDKVADDKTVLDCLIQERAAQIRVIAALEDQILAMWYESGRPLEDKLSNVKKSMIPRTAEMAIALFWVMNGLFKLEDEAKKASMLSAASQLLRMYGIRDFITAFVETYGINLSDSRSVKYRVDVQETN